MFLRLFLLLLIWNFPRKIIHESNMSTSSTESSQASKYAPEGPQEPSVSITSVRKRSIYKNKEEEEETDTAKIENPSPTSEQKDVKSAFLRTQPTGKNVMKVLLVLAISLSILFLINWFIRYIVMENSVSGPREMKVIHPEFSGEMAIELQSVVQKLRDQVEAFEEATKFVREKLDLLDTKLARIDLDKSATRATLEHLELGVSDINRSLSDIKNLPNDLSERINERILSEKFTEISDLTRMVIEEEIEKHEADGIGKADYALASGGAIILGHSEPGFPANEHKHLVHPDAIKMLQPSFGEPGQCFSLKGNSGYVQIRLRTEIVPESFSLEHVSHRVAYNMSSAPKDCNVTGWLDRNLSAPSTSQNETIEVHKLVNFRYELEMKNLQTFEVEKRSNQSEGPVVNVVRFEFASNYGANDTCIYRFRVHGHEANDAFRKADKHRSSATGESVEKSILLLAMLAFLTI